MKYLKIKNDGLLDSRLIYLMGGTTKANDHYKIGQFGTGIKYVLAWLLRNNIFFKIFIGGKELVISTKTEIIRDTEFNVIYINNERTSITTNMGLNWKAWMIIREIWCNALDEENGSYCETEEVLPEENSTEFYIQLTGEIKDVFDNWTKYFISQQPLQNERDFAIYHGGETLRLYKNGILIKEIENYKTVFAYDIKNANINELREFNGTASNEIVRIFPFLNKACIDILLNNIKGCYEETMNYDWYGIPAYGDQWKEAIGAAKFIDYDSYDKLIVRQPKLAEEPIIQVPKGLFKELIKHFPSVSILRVSDKVNTFYETSSYLFNEKIQICIKILESCNYFLDKDLKIITGMFGNSLTQGSINFDSKEIRLSEDLEHLSDIELIYVLIEENEHYRTSFDDCSREFQTHFLKLYTNMLLKQAKENISQN